MNSYQLGFLAGLKQDKRNPYLDIVTHFEAGEKAKSSGVNFSKEDWADKDITFMEGYRSSEMPHIASKGRMVKDSCKQWEQGFISGSHKLNSTVDQNVHNASFVVNVLLPKDSKESYKPFTQQYTYLDHRNEVYLIEARWRHGLKNGEHIIDMKPVLPSGISEGDILGDLGELTSIHVFDPCQSSHGTYRSYSIKGIEFRIKSFMRGIIKARLVIPEWNIEAANGTH